MIIILLDGNPGIPFSNNVLNTAQLLGKATVANYEIGSSLRARIHWDQTSGCGGFLSHRATPSHHPFIDGIFHEIVTIQRAIGVSLGLRNLHMRNLKFEEMGIYGESPGINHPAISSYWVAWFMDIYGQPHAVTSRPMSEHAENGGFQKLSPKWPASHCSGRWLSKYSSRHKSQLILLVSISISHDLFPFKANSCG